MIGFSKGMARNENSFDILEVDDHEEESNHLTWSKWLLLPIRRFLKNGGKLIEQRLSTLEDIQSGFDFVINCTGNGARALFGDLKVFPQRGQVHKVCFRVAVFSE